MCTQNYIIIAVPISPTVWALKMAQAEKAEWVMENREMMALKRLKLKAGLSLKALIQIQ